MNKILLLSVICFILASCGGNTSEKGTNPYTQGGDETKKEASGNPSYDPQRGEGKFTKVEIPPTLNKEMAEHGKKAFEVKCNSCHKVTGERLVGPGWEGVTKRHTAEWIMNFETNTDAMITKDPKAQAMLELCMVRMPNQNLSDEDARALYEFMRQIDGVK